MLITWPPPMTSTASHKAEGHIILGMLLHEPTDIIRVEDTNDRIAADSWAVVQSNDRLARGRELHTANQSGGAVDAVSVP